MSDTAIIAFAQLMADAEARRLKRREKEEWERKHAVERDRLTVLFKSFDDAGMRRLWDAYDGCNEPLGYTGEDIHGELNRRGGGIYCAV